MNQNLADDMNSPIESNNYDDDLPKGEQAQHNSEVRKRIDELLEQKRLKELLDDADDWEL